MRVRQLLCLSDRSLLCMSFSTEHLTEAVLWTCSSDSRNLVQPKISGQSKILVCRHTLAIHRGTDNVLYDDSGIILFVSYVIVSVGQSPISRIHVLKSHVLWNMQCHSNIHHNYTGVFQAVSYGTGTDADSV